MEAVASVAIEVQAASDAPGIPDETALRRWVCRALDGAGRHDALDVSLRIVDTAEMQALNREFRGKDRPTNVLAFPAGDIPGLPEGERRALGDLVVCAPVLCEEAVAQGKLLAHHWAHILVHGVLHLVGYDHGVPAEARRMEALETRILAAGGVADPYREPYGDR